MVRFLAGFWPIIALAFPVLELVGIVYIWHWIGAWTLIWLLASFLAGGALIAAERDAFMPRLAGAMRLGEDPFAFFKGSGLRFMAGLLLIFPGAISDVVALVMLIWSLAHPTPPAYYGQAETYSETYSETRADTEREGEVIEGEFRRMD